MAPLCKGLSSASCPSSSATPPPVPRPQLRPRHRPREQEYEPSAAKPSSSPPRPSKCPPTNTRQRFRTRASFKTFASRQLDVGGTRRPRTALHPSPTPTRSTSPHGYPLSDCLPGCHHRRAHRRGAQGGRHHSEPTRAQGRYRAQRRSRCTCPPRTGRCVRPRTSSSPPPSPSLPSEPDDRDHEVDGIRHTR